MTIQPRINQKGARTCWLLFLVWLVKLRYYEKVTKFEIKIFLLDLTFTKIPKTSHSDVVDFFETDSELALGKVSILIFKIKAFTFFVILYKLCKISKYIHTYLKSHITSKIEVHQIGCLTYFNNFLYNLGKIKMNKITCHI